MCIRDRDDYKRWESFGLKFWSYNHILPYFKKIESWSGGDNQYRGSLGPLPVNQSRNNNPLFKAFLNAASEAGHKINPDMNGEYQEGFGMFDTTIHNGERASVYKYYLNPAMRRKNLNIFTNSYVQKIIFDEKKAIGKPLNELKTIAKNKLIQLSIKKDTNKNLSNDDIDPFLPPQNDTVGSLHPLRIIRNKIIKIFRDIGFTIESGPEIEDDWYNFTALNFPKNHPAREMQDTFFISKNPDKVLRTHTSNVQIRLMEKQKPPIRVVTVSYTHLTLPTNREV